MSNKKDVADIAKSAFKDLRDKATDAVADLKEEVGYEDKTVQYINNLNANFDRVSDILDKAGENFKKGIKSGDFEKAFKSFMKAVKACVMIMKIGVVEAGEQLGINDALREKGIVKKSPINLMKDFERQIDDLETSLKEKAKESLNDVKQFAKDAKKQVQETVRGH